MSPPTLVTVSSDADSQHGHTFFSACQLLQITGHFCISCVHVSDDMLRTQQMTNVMGHAICDSDALKKTWGRRLTTKYN